MLICVCSAECAVYVGTIIRRVPRGGGRVGHATEGGRLAVAAARPWTDERRSCGSRSWQDTWWCIVCSAATTISDELIDLQCIKLCLVHHVFRYVHI